MNVVRVTFANTIRIAHIALWLTIPTTLWLWLGLAPPPDSCVPVYGWYEGNVLCLSEDTHLLMVFGLFLVGLFVFTCWIAGYCLEITRRVMNGDKMLPPVQISLVRKGWRLLRASFRYWLPSIAYIVLAMLVASSFELRIRNSVLEILLLGAAPILLALYWGNLVGIARYAAFDERSLICRRLENTRLALTNIGATLFLSGSLVAITLVSIFSAAVVSFLAGFADGLQVPDLLAEAALASFVFLFIVLCYCIVWSHLVAQYAKRIGICDNLKHSDRLW